MIYATIISRSAAGYKVRFWLDLKGWPETTICVEEVRDQEHAEQRLNELHEVLWTFRKARLDGD